MIQVIKATLEQKQALEGLYLNGHELRFVEDANGNWVVNDKVITNENFMSIREQLEALPIIEYIPKETTI